MTTKEMIKKRDLYVRQMLADGQGLIVEAKELEKNTFEDAADYKAIKGQLDYIEEIGAEVNGLREDIGVLSDDLKEYILPDLTDAEREKFGF